MALIKRWKGGKTGRLSMDICSCDICNKEYEQKTCITKYRRNGKIPNGRDLCSGCVIIEHNKIISECGKKALSKISKEQWKINASMGGKIGSQSPNNIKTRFNDEFWSKKTKEERQEYGVRANKGLQKKLKDPVYAAQHFAKVFAQTKIGYQSKGHKDLHSLIKNLGFKSHVQIGQITVDECNEELKIVIEYNGDMWHCNPRYWKAEQYNSAIRMTAGEKWRKDIIRHLLLKKSGYCVIVIWEKEWTVNAKKYLDRIKETYDEISKQKRNTAGNML